MAMARAWRAGLIGILTLLLMSAVQAAPERRVALVIGNSKYESVGRLPNPQSDAEMVATSLREAGFSNVTLSTDLTREKLVEALHRFSSDAENADWAVVYYAGHGIEVSGMNYLIPIDARLKTDRDLQYEAVPMTQVLGAVEGARKLRLLVLDACRDNPFAAAMVRSAGLTRSIGRGLARIEPDAGTLVAYSAKHGQVAEDGDGAHSPFVSALVKHINTPGLEINRLFRRVTSDVLVATNRRQEPFTYGSLPDEDFYFKIAISRPDLKSEKDRSGATSVLQAPNAEIKSAIAPQSIATPAVNVAPATMGPATTLPVDLPQQSDPQTEPRKKVASVDPSISPSQPVKPAAPRIKDKPILKHKVFNRPEPTVNRPKRVAQAAEHPVARLSRPTLRTRAAAPASSGGRCFTFNGVSSCN